ncbi:MAG TPA: hypothetical protein VGN80_18150 [Devosiaceae bacterium]|jgi:hypothetical protein|nr:hypothetical protein [Devosiaceae bacterium]
MKLTWFGGSTFRIHIGGQIIVTDADRAAAPVDVTELRSGADREIALGDLGRLPAIDGTGWRPPRAVSPLEVDDAPRDMTIGQLEGHVLLVHAAGDPPLLLAGGAITGAGRWSRDAVVVGYGAAVRTPEVAVGLLEVLGPKLLLLAAPAPELDVLFPVLREHLSGTALVALEAGMALEA